MKRTLLSLPILVIIVFIALFNIRPEPDQLRSYLIEPSESFVEGELVVQFLGNTNLVFSDGVTTIMTDGFFTRPAFHKMLWGKVEPKQKIVRKCLEKAGITQLDAVIPVHSHFDHALDAPMVADMTRATLFGSESTMNIGLGYGLSEEMMVVPPLNTPIYIGNFKITFIRSGHWQYPSEKQRALLLNQDITDPLEPPASIYDYKEGISYTLLIEYNDLKMAIQGSTGFRENSIEEFDADILFLAIAGIEVMDDAYNNNYQEHIIDAVHPEILVPIHWDDFTLPLSKGLKTTNLLFNMKMGSDLEKAFEIIETNNEKREIKLLPLWQRVSINDLRYEN
ncbi:MAG: MBL fold metallo-hydrolase [Bacteroidetes bacterium]|nr:MBL fold metallo-hydrolase [Bacteroidota bacterium]